MNTRIITISLCLCLASGLAWAFHSNLNFNQIFPPPLNSVTVKAKTLEVTSTQEKKHIALRPYQVPVSKGDPILEILRQHYNSEKQVEQAFFQIKILKESGIIVVTDADYKAIMRKLPINSPDTDNYLSVTDFVKQAK